MGMYTGSPASNHPMLRRPLPDSLKPVTGRPSISRYVAQLWERRHFIKAEARAKAFSGSRNMILGRAWLVISPLLDAGVYGIIFGLLLKTSRGIEHFIPFLLVGVTFFTLSNKSLNGGSGLLYVRRNFIKAFAFPRAALVFSHQLKFVYDALPVIFVTLVAIIIFPQGVRPSWLWLLFPIVFALQTLFNTGLMLLSASLTQKIPDLKPLLTYITRFWFYASGIFFSIDKVIGHHEILGQILKLNPAYLFITLYREILIYAQFPEFDLWVGFSLWAFGTFILGFWVFWLREEEYGRG